MINYILLLSLSFVFLTISFFIYGIQGEIVPFVAAETSNVKIFPDCGSITDHKIFFMVKGFSPNGNVHWEFIDSKGIIDSYGYFETDEFGSFEEYIIAEVIKPDIYTLRFFDDKNNNFLKDFNGSEVIITYQIPCANPIF
jgi:hypothetical protein